MTLPEINGLPIYLAFPDGQWAYDCVKCGSFCCKGNGFSATADEFVTLRRKYDGLERFAYKREGTLVDLKNLRGGCFFLQKDGLCRVQSELGREAKPFVCKAFPVNGYELCDEVMVVEARTLMCPIHLATDAPTESRIRHDETIAELESGWDAVLETANSFAAKPREDGSSRPRWTRALGEFEASMRDLVSERSDLNNFELWALHSAALEAYPAVGELPSEEALEEARQSLRDAQKCAVELFGFDSVEGIFDDPVLRSLTPQVRATLLTKMTFAAPEECLDMVPPALVVLEMFAEQARQLSGRALTVQETTSLVQQFLWPAVLSQVIDWIPYLDDEDVGDVVKLPMTLQKRASKFIDLINPNRDRAVFRSVVQSAGATEIPEVISLLNDLGAAANWLRFAPPQQQ